MTQQPTGMGEMDTDRVAGTLAAIVAEAGRLLAAVTDRGAGRVLKDDGSPTTAADLESERLILQRLAEAFPEIPVLAEESGTGVTGEQFFLVDPLDGTKDYLTGSGEYSVNVALISGRRPIAAALAAPSLGRVWAAGRAAKVAELAEDGVGSWQPATARRVPAEAAVALTSRRHGDAETERCLERFGSVTRRTASSAAKFGLIASGDADLYVRCGPTMEWDTAAGDHILTQAGGCVIGPDGRPLTYGHAERGYLNGPFVALGDPGAAGRVVLPAEAINPRRARA